MSTYATGKFAYGICDICGLRCAYLEMRAVIRNGRDTNLRSCPDCFDPDIRPRKLKVFATCEVRCKLKFSAKIDNAPRPAKKGHMATKRRTIMSNHVIKARKRWIVQKRIGKQKRYYLKLTKRALRTLKRQMHRKGRAGITVTARMHSVAGNRIVRRRIVMRTYKKGYRGRPARLG